MQRLDTILEYNANVGAVVVSVTNSGDEETSFMVGQWPLSWTGNLRLSMPAIINPSLQMFDFRDDKGLDGLNIDTADGDAFLFAWVVPAAGRANRIVVPVGETVTLGSVNVTGAGVIRVASKLGQFSRAGIVGGHGRYEVTGEMGEVTIGDPDPEPPSFASPIVMADITALALELERATERVKGWLS